MLHNSGDAPISSDSGPGHTIRTLADTVRRVTIISCACALSLLGSAWPVDLGVSGSGNHRHPVPGETQVLHWTVRNAGTARIDRVRLRIQVPADWGGPVERRLGSLPAGAVRRVTLRFTVP